MALSVTLLAGRVDPAPEDAVRAEGLALRQIPHRHFVDQDAPGIVAADPLMDQWIPFAVQGQPADVDIFDAVEGRERSGPFPAIPHDGPILVGAQEAANGAGPKSRRDGVSACGEEHRAPGAASPRAAAMAVPDATAPGASAGTWMVPAFRAIPAGKDGCRAGGNPEDGREEAEGSVEHRVSR